MTRALVAVGSIGGMLVGGYLGLMTERGFPGLITVVGAILGAGVGIYVAQLIAIAPSDDEP
jgi:hypothetical protein